MRITNNKGFSLVELMVVVAIIGILATMSVGAIQKQVAKSRQTEVKTNLSNLFTAEKAFVSEFGTYTGTFQYMKLAYEGDLRYNVGFTAVGANDAIATMQNNFGYTGPAPATSSFHTRGFCTAAGTCRSMQSAPATPVAVIVGGGVGAAPVAGAPQTATFVAAGSSNNLYKQNGDSWTINESKLLTNAVDALGGNN